MAIVILHANGALSGGRADDPAETGPPGFAVDGEGWTAGVPALPSPNFNDRPAGVQPTLVVIHNISLPPGQFGGTAVADFFCNRLDFDTHPLYEPIRDLCVSAHFLIDRMGQPIQFVSTQARAWHAGRSNFLGRENCNDFSIGIEMEGSDDCPFTDPQYATLARLMGALRRRYPIAAVAGHSDIAPDRKTDPGPHFDWQRLCRDAGLSSHEPAFNG